MAADAHFHLFFYKKCIVFFASVIGRYYKVYDVIRFAFQKSILQYYFVLALLAAFKRSRTLKKLFWNKDCMSTATISED